MTVLFSLKTDNILEKGGSRTQGDAALSLHFVPFTLV